MATFTLKNGQFAGSSDAELIAGASAEGAQFRELAVFNGSSSETCTFTIKYLCAANGGTASENTITLARVVDVPNQSSARAAVPTIDLNENDKLIVTVSDTSNNHQYTWSESDSTSNISSILKVTNNDEAEIVSAGELATVSVFNNHSEAKQLIVKAHLAGYDGSKLFQQDVDGNKKSDFQVAPSTIPATKGLKINTIEVGNWHAYTSMKS